MAGSGSTDLQMELSDPFAVEHGVEGGHLVYVHFVDLRDFSHLSHGGQGEEVVVLLLGQVQERNDG